MPKWVLPARPQHLEADLIHRTTIFCVRSATETRLARLCGNPPRASRLSRPLRCLHHPHRLAPLPSTVASDLTRRALASNLPFLAPVYPASSISAPRLSLPLSIPMPIRLPVLRSSRARRTESSVRAQPRPATATNSAESTASSSTGTLARSQGKEASLEEASRPTWAAQPWPYVFHVCPSTPRLLASS